MYRAFVVAILFIFYCFSDAQVPVENCPQIPPHTPVDINDVSPSVRILNE